MAVIGWPVNVMLFRLLPNNTLYSVNACMWLSCAHSFGNVGDMCHVGWQNLKECARSFLCLVHTADADETRLSPLVGVGGVN